MDTLQSQFLRLRPEEENNSKGEFSKIKIKNKKGAKLIEKSKALEWASIEISKKSENDIIKILRDVQNFHLFEKLRWI